MTLAALTDVQAALTRRYAFNKLTSNSSLANGMGSSWTQTSVPSAGAVPPTGAGEVPTNATTGAFPIVNAASGKQLYLARWSASGGTGLAGIALYDRLVHTSGLSSIVTTAQTVNSASVNRPDSSGLDARLFLEWYVSTGATATTATVSYTNQSGTAGQIGTAAIIASMSANNLVPVQLAAGDIGVQSVQAVTFSVSTGTAGNIGVTIARQIGFMYSKIGSPYIAEADYMDLGLAEVPNNACLFFASMAFGLSITTEGELTLIEA